jgi:hypothetical protein
MSRKRPDWSKALPRPLVIPDIMKLCTLGDIRELVEKRLPTAFREKSTWQTVTKALAEAARGETVPGDAAITLRLVLQLEGVPCREG